LEQKIGIPSIAVKKVDEEVGTLGAIPPKDA
jgi:hypothetical protein